MEHPKQILSRYGLEPKKSLGQNFLYDDNILAAIVAAAPVNRQDHVLEIGAGLGALTQHLADAARSVVAVEIDQRLLPILREEVAARANVDIVQADILALDPGTWFGQRSFKVVANVPYYITGAILEHLLGGESKPEAMVLTLQKEVAERIAAGPGDMTHLAVSVQLYGKVRIVREISAGAFWPRPDVDSAILRFERQPQALLSPADEKAFFRLVRAGFSQKRKQLQKNLRALGFERRETVALLKSTGIDPKRRAETLSIEEWLRVYDALQQL
ncbi:MAG TPA: 16S rRNA (adenine(1518)-N(6)/adenine(1519)-N(6))-dimethyltransferase RsmA [Candidatus Binatia bacterium]|nr:16S rRNA (adenine(1518)-N(6)/adenine(1519)-N(6))-dimethyltransferase RsmA [Candidatus Binatia bacterium]